MVGKELPRVQQDPKQLLKTFSGADFGEVRRTALNLSSSRQPAHRSEESLFDERMGLVLRRCGELGADLMEPARFAVDRRQDIFVILCVNRLEQIRLVRGTAIAVGVARRAAEDRGGI